MQELQMSDKLSFLLSRHHQDEAGLLAEALREGVGLMYRQALIEAWLLGEVSRDRVLEAIGPEELETLEYQRDMLKRDVEWGLSG